MGRRDRLRKEREKVLEGVGKGLGWRGKWFRME